MPFQGQALAVLQRWREVEAALTEVPDGSLEAEALQSEALCLRDQYQAVVAAARSAHRPEPPPFPVSSE